MGVEASYAIENSKTEALSSDYFDALSKLAKGDNSQAKILNEIEAKISDPSIRAFLAMKRLEQNIKSK